jgi:hypothetical protein
MGQLVHGNMAKLQRSKSIARPGYEGESIAFVAQICDMHISLAELRDKPDIAMLRCQVHLDRDIVQDMIVKMTVFGEPLSVVIHTRIGEQIRQHIIDHVITSPYNDH